MTSDSQNEEVEKIAGQLRASIRKASVQRAPASAALEDVWMPTANPIAHARISLPANAAELDAAIAHDLALLRLNYDIAGAPFTSHRRVLGRLIIVMKNIARELLVQLLARQSVYNGASTRAITHLKDRLDSLAAEQARIARRLAALESRIGAAPAQPESRPSRPPAGTARAEGLELRRLNARLNALEDAVAGRYRRA